MKKHFLKVLSLILAVTIFSGAAFLTMFSRAEAYVYEPGDIIEFGSYPQTLVKDSETIEALDSVNKNWISYRFYSGEGYYGSLPAYGSMTAGDFMTYADIEFNGEKYRAVLIKEFRPLSTIATHEVNGQTKNFYYDNITYYFKFEPISWRVLDPSTGLVLCEKAIDAQAFNNDIYWIDLNADGKTDFYTEFFNDYEGTVYANNYEHSSIRKWLNDDFYSVAFNETEKSFIADTSLSDITDSNGDAISDFVFLPSYDDVLNPDYGFSSSPSDGDPARIVDSTDYSNCLGNYVTDSGKTAWTLRSSFQKSDAVSAVKNTGLVFRSEAPTYETGNGIRPAIRIPSVVEREYTLSFNANGGSGAPQSVTDKTNTVSVPDILPTYEGHYFKGWATDKNAVEPTVMPGDDFRLTNDIILYAVWGKNSYKTVWKSDGVEIYSEDVLFGEAVSAPAIFSKEGYTFAGWNPDVPTKMPAKDLEFNATWKINTHSVTWIVDGNRTTVNYKYGDKIVVPENPVLGGCVFIGWDKEIPETVPDKDLEFTAVFKNLNVTHIEVISNPSKTTYVYKSKDSLSTDGLKIKAYYSDGSSKVIDDASQMTFSGFSTKKPVGTKEIRVEYQGASATFNIKVQYVWWQQIIRILLLGFLWY